MQNGLDDFVVRFAQVLTNCLEKELVRVNAQELKERFLLVLMGRLVALFPRAKGCRQICLLLGLIDVIGIFYLEFILGKPQLLPIYICFGLIRVQKVLRFA